MRVVVDTNIVLSGLLWRGAPSKLVTRVSEGRASCWTSQELLDELAEVLRRPKHANTLLKSGHSAAEWIETFTQMLHLVDPEALSEPIAPDSDDDWVIATAIAANADLIVTGDKPFLGVGTVGTIRIVSVHDALALIG